MYFHGRLIPVSTITSQGGYNMKTAGRTCFLFFMVWLSSIVISFAEMKAVDSIKEAREALGRQGLHAEAIRLENFHKGIAPQNFLKRAGSAYKPSYNEDPAIRPSAGSKRGTALKMPVFIVTPIILPQKNMETHFPLEKTRSYTAFQPLI
jgi:hypothetical protein